MTATTPASTTTTASTGEREDLLAALAQARYFLRYTARELTDEQAAARPTVSALCIGGLIKHVTDSERNWARFLVEGPSAMASDDGRDFADWTEEDFAEREKGFQLLPGETLAGVLEAYAMVAQETDEIIRSLPSLDTMTPLPEAPWFTEKAWSARRAVLTIIAETTQHSGHADIIRETLDGAKSMG
ncbi:DinB family protein [Microlunatus soli]|uniref:DinB superfamily protein n=1 Tax=Microlunatus soli TaxID=630515 RepID=A0A1H1P5Y5_9ACTN|nr:DinB family protein [Microlunatus soli]SDS06698.1 Protein of unknown function [Microlunatus soli]